MEANCKNCDLTLQPDYAHCPKCGQKTRLHRLSMHDLVHEALHYFTHADKGLFQLIRDLAVKNGRVAREFVEGKRKRYYPPLTFFLLAAAIHLFISTKTDDHVNVDVIQKYPELANFTDPAQHAKWVNFYERREHGIHFINTNANIIMMVSLPIVAFIFWLFYRKRDYNYTEHLVGGMYMFAFYTLCIALYMGVGYLLQANETFVYVSCMVFEVAYFTIFYRNFMQGTKMRAFWASFTSILTLFLISFIIMSVYMFAIK